MKNEAITWTDPYAKKDPKEAECFATCVIDGYAWRVAPEGQTYCAGKAENLNKGGD